MVKKCLLLALAVLLVLNSVACDGKKEPTWKQVQAGLTKVIARWNTDIVTGAGTDSYDQVAAYIAYRWAVSKHLEAVTGFVLEEATAEIAKRAVDFLFPTSPLVTEALRGLAVKWLYKNALEFVSEQGEFRSDNVTLTVAEVNELTQRRGILPAVGEPVRDLPSDLVFTDYFLVGYEREAGRVSVLVIADWGSKDGSLSASKPRAWEATYEIDSDGLPKNPNQSLRRIDLKDLPEPVVTPTPAPERALTPSPAPTAAPKTWHVDDNLQDYPDADFSHISDALSAASAGDTIIVYPGTYTENLDVSKDQLTIKSESGADSTVVQAMDPRDHVFEIEADHIEIQGLTIQGATGNEKAGIYSYDSPLSVSDLILSNNNYGIYAYSTSRSPFRVSRSTFSGNNRGIYSHSSFGSRYGEVHVSDSTFSDNNYGIYTSDFCGVNISNSAFPNNDYGIYGYNRMNIYAEHSIFSNNTYGIYGNSIWGINSLHSSFDDNDYGVYAVNGWDNTLSISYSNFRNNGWVIYYRASTLSSHIIFLNNFINNTNDVDSSASEYTWNSPEQITYTYNGKTYTSYLGNHWSQYMGTDTDGDGIGGAPYSINSEEDDYPLMKPSESYIAISPSP